MNRMRELHPDATHPITVTPTGGEVTVRVGGRVIARSTAALTLAEASYDAVQYLPIGDVPEGTLERTDHSSYCPYKGTAGYYSLSAQATGGEALENVVWTYEEPYDAVAPIAGHVAFYADKVDLSLA